MNLFQFFNNKLASSKIANQSSDRLHPHVPDFREAGHYDGDLDGVLEYLAQFLGPADDYIVRPLQVYGREAAIVFISTISDAKIIKTVVESLQRHQFPRRAPKNMAHYVMKHVVPQSEALYLTNLFEIKEAIVSGDIVLFIDGAVPGIVVTAQSVEHRSPEQPTQESSSRGSQVSFVEHVNINIGLIRRSLKSESLEVQKIKIGYRSHTDVAVVYMRDVVNPVVLTTVIKRLKNIHIDFVSQSSAIEQRISDNHWTMFPQIRTTPRVDSTCREINQGKVAIIVDNDPVVMLAPTTVLDFFQTQEDYTHTSWEGTYVRFLRFVAFMFALYLPALYIAFVDFNPELLPRVLGLQIARSRAGVPFPAVIEAVTMLVLIEILREATLRMPKQMGQTLGIVGGIVVGEASVQAGLVSNILVVIISLTAISVFVTPSYEFATVIRLAMWPMIIGASLFGLYGVMAVTLLYAYHLASLKSFGVSYLDPFNGEHIQDLLTDGLFRLPTWAMDRRAAHLHPVDATGEMDYSNPVPHPQLEKPRSAGEWFMKLKRNPRGPRH